MAWPISRRRWLRVHVEAWLLQDAVQATRMDHDGSRRHRQLDPPHQQHLRRPRVVRDSHRATQSASDTPAKRSPFARVLV